MTPQKVLLIRCVCIAKPWGDSHSLDPQGGQKIKQPGCGLGRFSVKEGCVRGYTEAIREEEADSRHSLMKCALAADPCIMGFVQAI